MRRLSHLFLSLFALPLLLPISLQSQEYEEHMRLLEWFEGSWSYDQMEGGAECARLGDFMVHCKSVWTTDAGTENEAVFIYRFERQTESWKAYRFYKNGYADTGNGWLDGDNWTVVYDMPNGTKARFASVTSGDVWTYAWHRTIQGGPWEQASEGSMTRVR